VARRSFAHWTPRYVYDRLAAALDSRRHPDAPWLTKQMVEILDSWLCSDDIGYEFGSGRSTLWFSQRVGHLTSVEHDREWYCRISATIESMGLRNVHYSLHTDGVEYCNSVCGMPDESLDFVLIDGIERDACALLALRKLKPGGVLILDNCNWYLPNSSRSPNSRRRADGPASPEWVGFGEKVKNWRRIWTSNGITDTVFLLKPATCSHE
jgi:hypothetical protein